MTKWNVIKFDNAVQLISITSSSSSPLLLFWIMKILSLFFVANRREALVRIMMWSRTALLALIWFSLILYREKEPQISHNTRSKLDATVVPQKTSLYCIFRRSSKLWLKCDVNLPIATLFSCSVLFITHFHFQLSWACAKFITDVSVTVSHLVLIS